MRSHFTVVVGKCSVIVWIAIKIRIWRIVFKVGIFGNSPNCIDAHSINAHIKPKSHYVFHFSTYFRIIPIQIWLRFQERMQVKLPSALVKFPRTAARQTSPIVRLAIIFSITPNIVIALEIVARRFGLLKPRMLV